MLSAAIEKIDQRLFHGRLDGELIWATAQAKDLLLDLQLNRNERWIKLTKEISIRYPDLNHIGGVFLAATAMSMAEIGG